MNKKNTSIGQDIIDLMTLFNENKKEMYKPILEKIDKAIKEKKVLKFTRLNIEDLSFLLGNERLYFYTSRFYTKSSIIYQALKDEIIDRINN